MSDLDDDYDALVWPHATGNDPTHEPWRELRMQRLAGAIGGISPERLGRISRLHDHKGNLTVFWREMPQQADMEAVEALWTGELFCENHEVEHVVGAGLVSPAPGNSVAWTPGPPSAYSLRTD